MPYTILQHTLPVFHRNKSTHQRSNTRVPSTPTTSPSESSASLLSSHASSTPSTNYEEAFGTLASSYGFPGSVPSVPSKASLSQPQPLFQSQRSSYASSQSQSSSSSKNYEAAFGSLCSSYGFGGSAPVVPVVASTPAARPASQPHSTPRKSVAQQPKNYEAAFGQLSSSYGFSGSAAPSWSRN